MTSQIFDLLQTRAYHWRTCFPWRTEQTTNAKTRNSKTEKVRMMNNFCSLKSPLISNIHHITAKACFRKNKKSCEMDYNSTSMKDKNSNVPHLMFKIPVTECKHCTDIIIANDRLAVFKSRL